MNRVTAIGRLTKDPETRSAGNSTVTSFDIACDSSHRREEGGYIPIFYRVSAWGKSGEQCAKFLHKGDMCAASGELFSRSYTKKDGSTGYSLEIENATVKFLGQKRQQSAAVSDMEEDAPPF